MANQFEPWTSDQLEYLDQHYGTMPAEEIAERVNHPIGGVYKKARLRGLADDRGEWDDTETEQLIHMLEANETYIDIADALDRSYLSTVGKARRMGYPSKFRAPNTEWQGWQEEVVRRFYPTVSSRVLADYLEDKTDTAIRAKANRMGLKKDNLEVTQAYGNAALDDQIEAIKRRCKDGR